MSSIAIPSAGLAPRRAWLTDLPVLLVAVVWGASYLAAKDITTAHTVTAVLVLRFGLVVPVLVAAGRRGLRALTAAQWRGAGLLGLVLSGIFLLETYGVVHTSATNAGLIISLTMIFTPLAEAAVKRVRPPRAFLAAAALSVAGVVLLTQGGGFTAPSAGDLLMLLAALARTAHVLFMARIKSVQGADSLSLTTVQLGGAVAVFAVLAAVPGTGPAPWTVAAGFGAARVGRPAVPVRVLHAVRVLRADVGGPPHLPVPRQPPARHRTAVGGGRRHRARRRTPGRRSACWARSWSWRAPAGAPGRGLTTSSRPAPTRSSTATPATASTMLANTSWPADADRAGARRRRRPGRTTRRLRPLPHRTQSPRPSRLW